MGGKTKLALDLGPLFCFFLFYRCAGLLAATAGLIAATMLSLAIIYVKERKLAVMPLVSGILVTVLGGMTLLLHNEVFIKIKPTLVNLLFAGVLLGGLALRKPMLKYLLGDVFQMSEQGWLILSRRWGIFFLFLAGLNEVIWRNFPTDFWVNFKVFGMFSLTMAFTLSQLPLMKRYWVEPGEETANQ